MSAEHAEGLAGESWGEGQVWFLLPSPGGGQGACHKALPSCPQLSLLSQAGLELAYHSNTGLLAPRRWSEGTARVQDSSCSPCKEKPLSHNPLPLPTLQSFPPAFSYWHNPRATAVTAGQWPCPSRRPPRRPRNVRIARLSVSSATWPCAWTRWTSTSTTVASRWRSAQTAASMSCSACWPSTEKTVGGSSLGSRKVRVASSQRDGWQGWWQMRVSLSHLASLVPEWPSCVAAVSWNDWSREKQIS